MKIEYLFYYGEVVSEISYDTEYVSLFLIGNFFARTRLCKLSDEILDVCLIDQPDDLFAFVSGLDIEALQAVSE